MSTTIAAVAGTNGSGLGTERHVVYALHSALYWAFAYTGTNVLSTWHSPDNTTWSAGATHTLTNAHLSEGRNLSVGITTIGVVDVVRIGIPYKTGTNIGVNTIRATISGTTITFHTSETVLNAGTSDPDALYWTGATVEIDSNALWHVGAAWSSANSSFNGAMDEQASSTDPGTVEQMTPSTWTDNAIDASQLTERRSGYLFDTDAGTMGYIADDGSATTTTTGLEWATWPGSGAWSQGSGLGNVDVTGTISAINHNDWGAARRTATDLHVVYRSAAGSFVHRRWNGTSWGAGQTIPSGASPASGTGVALCSDGFSVWLNVIDNDSANTVRTLRWTNGYANGTGADAWDATWTATETSTQTRTWIGVCKDIVGQTGLVYWTEGSNFVATTFSAISPDPLWVQSAQGSSNVSQSSFGVAFTSANITAGNRIIIFACIFGNSGAVISSVTDSAGNTYAKDSPTCVLSDASDLSVWSAPIVFGAGTKPTVTIHASLASFVWGLTIHEYVVSHATSAYLDGSQVNNTSAVASPATSGASTPVPGATGELAFGVYGDTNSQASIVPSSGWTQRGTSILGAGLGESCCADQTTITGTGSNASFVIPSTGGAAGIIVVVYQLAAGSVLGGPPFPALSGLQSLPPQSPVVGLFATFAQPWSAPLGPTQAAAATIVATFVRGERISPSSRSRSKAVLAAPLTPTFLGVAPLREQKVVASTKSRPRIVLPAVRAASPFPTRPNLAKPSPSTKARPRSIRPMLPAASPFSTLPNRAKLSPSVKARPRIIFPASISVAATIAAIRLQAARRSPSTRSRPYDTVATAAIIVATATPTIIRMALRGPGLRSRTRRVVAAPQTATTGSVRALRAPTRSPAVRSRSVRLRPVAPSLFVPPLPSTLPMRVPLLPVPTRARPRFIVSPVPLPPGIFAVARRNRVAVSFVRARPRFVPGANVVLGTPQRRLRNRVVTAVTIARSRRITPATATLQPGVPPTTQRELRVT